MARWEVHRVDTTEPLIIDAMRHAGATVHKIGRPLDLLIAVDEQTAMGECKTGKGKLRATQQKFTASWPGLWRILRTPDDGLQLVRVLKRRAAEQRRGHASVSRA